MAFDTVSQCEATMWLCCRVRRAAITARRAREWVRIRIEMKISPHADTRSVNGAQPVRSPPGAHPRKLPRTPPSTHKPPVVRHRHRHTRPSLLPILPSPYNVFRHQYLEKHQIGVPSVSRTTTQSQGRQLLLTSYTYDVGSEHVLKPIEVFLFFSRATFGHSYAKNSPCVPLRTRPARA